MKDIYTFLIIFLLNFIRCGEKLLTPPRCFLQRSSWLSVAWLVQHWSVCLHRGQTFPQCLASFSRNQQWLPLSTLHCLPCLCSILCRIVGLCSFGAHEKERQVKPPYPVLWDWLFTTKTFFCQQSQQHSWHRVGTVGKRSSLYTRLAQSQVSLSLTLAPLTHMLIYCHSHKGCLLWAPGLHKLPCPAALFYSPSVFADIFFLLTYQHQEGLADLSPYPFYGCNLPPTNTCLFHKLIQNRSITPSNKPCLFFCTHFYLALISIPTMSHQLFSLILGTPQ